MGGDKFRGSIEALARRQHGIVTTQQLLAVGLTGRNIEHRARSGRLHRVRRGVYAVGRRELTDQGLWLAAVLACGDRAVLSHAHAAVLWRIVDVASGPVNVTIPSTSRRAPRGVEVHRRRHLGSLELRRRERIPVTSPVCTLVDLASVLPRPALERAIDRADTLGLASDKNLRRNLESFGPRAGLVTLRDLLDEQGFRLTRSELERRFLILIRQLDLPTPLTRRKVNGYEVDFYWPTLDLVVETDGGRFHRTARQQTRDRERDQAHLVAGTTAIRFTHWQVAHDGSDVISKLTSLAARLS